MPLLLWSPRDDGTTCCGQAAARPGKERLKHLAVELVGAFAVLDLEHPEIGIACDLAGDVGVGVGLRHRVGPGAAASGRFAVERARLGGDGDARLEAVELHQPRAGLGIAAPPHGGRNERAIAEPHLRAPPQPGVETHHHIYFLPTQWGGGPLGPEGSRIMTPPPAARAPPRAERGEGKDVFFMPTHRPVHRTRPARRASGSARRRRAGPAGPHRRGRTAWRAPPGSAARPDRPAPRRATTSPPPSPAPRAGRRRRARTPAAGGRRATRRDRRLPRARRAWRGRRAAR